MKRKLFFAIFSSFLIYQSCGSNSNEGDSSNLNENEEKGLLENLSDAKGAVNSLSKMEEYAKEMETRIKELKDLTPVSIDVLKSALPEEIDGMKRSSYEVGEMSAMNISTGKAEYASEDGNRRLSLEIMDGAGEAASGLASILLLALQTDKDSENQSGFERTTDLNGIRALIKERSSGESKYSEIQWIKDKRFIMTLKGDGFAYNDLATIQQKLNFGDLK